MADKIKITLEHEGQKIGLTLPDDLQISPATLNQNLSQQPGLYAFYATVAAHLALGRDKLAQDLRDTSARVEIRVRQTAAATPAEKWTEAKIAAKVALEPEVLKARETLQAAERMSSEANVIKEALFQRLQALIALSANVRNEMSQTGSR